MGTEVSGHCREVSLRGRRSKGKGKGIRARGHARGRRGTAFLFFLPRGSRAQIPPSPSAFNACHASYREVGNKSDCMDCPPKLKMAVVEREPLVKVAY